MNNSDLLKYGVLAAGGFLLINAITKNAAATFAGETAGESVANLGSGAVIGGLQGILINPYTWARNYQGYIPIIDDAASASVKLWNYLFNPKAGAV